MMPPTDMLRILVAIAAALALGSFLPANALARGRGVDIRGRGDGNPGTINAVRVLGWGPGLLTAVYDLSVGVVAVWIAGLLAVPAGFGYLAGLATIVGHRFPVFSALRGGGQGMAASAGLLVYGVGEAAAHGWLTGAESGLLLAVLLVAFLLTRSDSAAGIVMLPLLVGMMLLSRADWPFIAFMCAVAGYIWVVQLAPARRSVASRAVRPAHGRTRD